jgi:hypothetical protein
MIFNFRSASPMTQSCGSLCACSNSASDSSLSGTDSTYRTSPYDRPPGAHRFVESHLVAAKRRVLPVRQDRVGKLPLRRRGEADVLPVGLGPQNALRLLVKRLQVAGDQVFRCSKRLERSDVAQQRGVYRAHRRACAADRLALYGAALVLHEQRRRDNGEQHHRRQRAGDHEVEV